MRRGLVLLAAALPLVGCAVSDDVAEPGFTPVETTTTESKESSTSSSSETTPASAAPDCTNEALRRSGFGEFNMSGCIGNFSRPGVPKSDNIVLMQWVGDRWTMVESDGFWDGMGMNRPCHNRAKLEGLGVPTEYINAEAICGEYPPGQEPPTKSSTPSSTTVKLGPPNDGRYIQRAGRGEWGEEAYEPACDGRYILILDSIIDYGDRSDTINRIADWVMRVDPTGKPRRFMVPGHCPSLRAQLDGNDIYPVLLDFGTDSAGVCEAKAAYGGNARVLSNTAEYVDPC